MSWSSASAIVDELIALAVICVPYGKRYKFYSDLIRIFENHDWTGVLECMGADEQFDTAARDLHPNWDWDEEDD